MPSSGMRPSRPSTLTPSRVLVGGALWTSAVALASAVFLKEVGLPSTSWQHGLLVGTVIGISLTLTMLAVIRTARHS